ncbi:hypothetical protein H6G20_02135 [Desertifilum sp. FACHB-1129]|uniref:Uncharacterized protein n=1 Tax=Desertifilum tharense IPPAS B-1220 TaxID=1781255 RepID=A0A1E5QDQ4_9CYAN|nr:MULTISPECIES: HpsJ family protein [Desertifilum]MDA0208991.1 HpsJ family protein [Cyanobacteria bacterium FC1]MBD2310473.1 hypothetical protein [Desertifilum sp. FACHB-1129]MBD2321925.1 hypothetical protein [Desertifilum sp. FACHB-866]MBD2332052.1 hypothetical protein [Desertifilum sp. FACHB-868]OEJ72789.1 hypothetical protein BH720_22695 [Desertifilum tharense IPPAS B-1220]
MKATNSGTISNLAARALQLVGIVMIASFLLDALTLLFPPNLTNVQWRLSFTSQLIDRGVIPLVGTALLLAGLWLSSDPADSSSTSSGQSFLRGVSLVLAWILGVTYLIVTPLHTIDTIRDRNLALTRIEQEATRAETQLQAEIGRPEFRAELERQESQFKTQVNELLRNDEQLNQLLSSGQVAPEQANLLQEFRSNPAALDQFVTQQTQALPERALARIRTGRREAEEQAQIRTVKSISRGLSSLLLAVGFVGIGWTGISGGMGGRPRTGRRKSRP